MKPPGKVPRGTPHFGSFAQPILSTLKAKTGAFHQSNPYLSMLKTGQYQSSFNRLRPRNICTKPDRYTHRIINRRRCVQPDIKSMSVLFDLLREETEPSVRVVLGHFIFVYIHPYIDGNGRMGRFMMNVMLASGGYPWTVVPVEQRATYMAALEEASVNQNIIPFADFLVG